MSFALLKKIGELESGDDLHVARLLLLLQQADKRKTKTVNGITKLAKLDFLLRYPNCLERTAKALGRDLSEARVQAYERTTVESKMIRFRYGPWDDRYRRWIGLMVARGLVDTFVRGRTVHVGLTEAGRNVAAALAAREEFEDLDFRSMLIYRMVGSYGGIKLKDFIYTTFPELSDMKWGDPIDL